MILAEKNDGIFSDDYNITPNSYEDFFTQFNTMGVLSQADKAQIAFLVLCFEIWVALILQALTQKYQLSPYCHIQKWDPWKAIGIPSNITVLTTLILNRKRMPPSTVFVIYLALMDLIFVAHAVLRIDEILNYGDFRAGKTLFLGDLQLIIFRLFFQLGFKISFAQYIFQDTFFVFRTTASKLFLWLSQFS